MAPILECKSLMKTYSGKMALCGVDLSLEKGKIVEEGSSKNFFENPKQERTKDFLRKEEM